MDVVADYSHVHGAEVIGDPGQMPAKVGVGAPPMEAWPSDVAVSAHETDLLALRAASVRGVLHRNTRNPGPRQDAYGIMRDETTRTVVVVVCDGVGSLKRSHEAAAHACNSLPQHYLECRSWAQALQEVNSELLSLQGISRQDASLSVPSMATTVIGAAIEQQSDGHRIDLVSVGDSQAWFLEPDLTWGRVDVSRKEDSDGLATGRTRALPATRVQYEERSLVKQQGRLFLLTDGVADPLAMNTDVQQTLAQWWDRPPDAFAFARQVAFARKTFVDDRTVVGIWMTAPRPTEQGPFIKPSAISDCPQDASDPQASAAPETESCLQTASDLSESTTMQELGPAIIPHDRQRKSQFAREEQ